MLDPKPTGEMAAAMLDLEIPYEDMFVNREEFSKRVQRKARELSAQLDRKTPLADVESAFKAKSHRNEDAKNKAKEIYSQILDLVVGEDPEVLANLLQMLTGVSTTVENEVRAMAIREASDQILSKRHVHLLYQRLQKGYDVYVKFCKLMYSENYSLIPSKPGNYADNTGSSGIKIYRIYVTNETGEEIMFMNPFPCAKYLGVEIKFFMDLFEILEENDYEIKGRKVRLQEVPR